MHIKHHSMHWLDRMKRRGFFRVGCLLLFAVALVVPQSFAAAAPKYNNSLDLIPADAAFYSASLRLREQVEIVANSKAWAKLTRLPAVQMAWQFGQMGLNQPNGPLQQMREFMADPENQELLQVVGDAFSSDVFVYGDHRAADFIGLSLRTYNSIRYGSMVAGFQSRETDGDTAAKILLNSLNSNLDKLEVPTFLFGFKISNEKTAQKQLDRLEKHAQLFFNSQPQFQGRFKKVSIGGADFLTLTLDGGMVPWHELPWGRLEQQPGQYDQLKAKLLKSTVCVSLGIKEKYLLFSIASSNDHLATLGGGKTLAELPEFKPLEKYAGERLIDISYVSQSLRTAVANTAADLDEMVQAARQLLPLAGLPEELNARILKDAEELAGDLKHIVPKTGAATSVSFLTQRGVERYSYDWSQNLYYDGSKPLEILDHIGGNPLIAAASRSKYSPEEYETMRKWVKRAFGYFEDFGVPQIPADEQGKYVKIKEIALPLVARLDRATSEMLLPALADGQSAFVLDAKITSQQWFESLPQNGQSLPMLEAALVFGVNDAALLKKACAEYADIVNTALDKVLEIDPNAYGVNAKPPHLELREHTQAKDGTIYWNKLPGDWGVDSQLTPNLGLGEHVAVAALTPKQAERILSVTPLTVIPDGPLSDRKRPLAAASIFQWAATLDTATPWIDFLVRQLAPRAAEAAGPGFFMANEEAKSALAQANEDSATVRVILEQVHTLLEVMKTFQAAESATYFEGEATVTHSLSLYHDLP